MLAAAKRTGHAEHFVQDSYLVFGKGCCDKIRGSSQTCVCISRIRYRFYAELIHRFADASIFILQFKQECQFCKFRILIDTFRKQILHLAAPQQFF